MSRMLAAALTLLFVPFAEAADLPADEGSPSPSQLQAEGPAAMRTYAACRRAIALWAEPFSPVDVQTVSVGPVQRNLKGTKTAPLYVRIVYDTAAGRETRKAHVRCSVSGSDAVEVSPID